MKTIKQVLADYIARENADIDSHNAVRAILEPLEGKPIDGRTFNKKRLPKGYKFYAKHSWYVIEAPTGKEHRIGYNFNPYVSIADFERYDLCNGSAALARIKRCEELDIKELEETFGDIAKGLELIFNAFNSPAGSGFNNPAHYDLLLNIWDENKTPYNKFVLSEMYYPAMDYKKNGNKLVN